MKKFLYAGDIVSIHSLHGEVKVRHSCDSADFLQGFKTLYFDNGSTPIAVERSRVHKGMLLLKLAEIDTPEAAARLRGKKLYISRDDVKLAQGQYFVEDLLGLSVEDADSGKVYGTLCEVSQTGANEVYHIKKEDKVVLIPVISDVIVQTDLENKRLLIRPLKGLFDDAD